MRKLTNKLMKLSAILFVSTSCAHAPKAPVGHICGINNGHKLCFNFETDFDQDGYLKADAKGVSSPLTQTDLTKAWLMDGPSKEELQAYALKWKQRYLQLQKDCR